MNKRATSNMEHRDHRQSRERGFTVLQLLVAIAVAGIISAFALIGIARSRDNIRLQGSVRQLSGYMEKARLDAIRRHTTTSVTFTNATTYSVTMDFDGGGTPTTRNFSFEDGVVIFSTPLPSVTFNWRGRTLACTLTFAMKNNSGEQSWVDVSDAGDVTVNSDVDVLPTVSYANVNSTTDISTGTVVSGNTVHNNTADCGGSSGTVAPPITGNGSGGCSMTANFSAISIKKGGGSTGTVSLSVTGSGTFNVTASGPSNLQISPTSVSLTSGGSATFSITSLNKTRGTFAVNFSSSCTTVTVAVKVTN
ncbi:MAG: hypothetical protein QOC96_1358 [Acidobacteriota bacterium]|jgi:type II secretory pathway pseudopilin PulG|nr:hypothetical protein [Acidobacteriota bacterium]